MPFSEKNKNIVKIVLIHNILPFNYLYKIKIRIIKKIMEKIGIKFSILIKHLYFYCFHLPYIRQSIFPLLIQIQKYHAHIKRFFTEA